MLHIVLTILAVIGKILLGVLGFILLLLLLILIAPIRYGGTFQKQDKDMQAKASVSWLLRFLHVQVSWIEKKISFEVRILGIPLIRLFKWIKGRGKKRKKKAEKKTESDKTEAIQTNTETRPELSQETETQMQAQPEEKPAEATIPMEPDIGMTAEPQSSAEPVIPESAAVPAGAGSAEPAGEAAPAEETEPKVSPLKKIASLIEKVLGIPEKVSNTVRGISEKVKAVFSKVETLKAKADEVLDILKSQMFREVFACVKKELLAIVRHILPQKLWGRVEFGMGDPGSTGEILTAIAAVYPVLPEKLIICPNFEESVIDCDLSLKGRIRLITLVFHAVKVLLNKQVRRLIKKVRHKEA